MEIGRCNVLLPTSIDPDPTGRFTARFAMRCIYHNWKAKYGWRYLNEFSFRLNEGNVKHDTTDRLQSLLDAMIGSRLTFAELTANG